jgi:hypothetical protein
MGSDAPSIASEAVRTSSSSSISDFRAVASDDMSNDIDTRGIACAIEDQSDEYDDIERQLLSMISRGSVYADTELSSDVVIDDDDEYRMPTVVSGLGLSRKMKREPAKNTDAS